VEKTKDPSDLKIHRRPFQKINIPEYPLNTMHSDPPHQKYSYEPEGTIDPGMLSPFAYPYKRALEYPSPMQDKRICLQDQVFELAPTRSDYPDQSLPLTPLSPAFPKTIRLQLPPSPRAPVTVSAPVITMTAGIPTKRVIAVPKKHTRKDPTIILPSVLRSDNGKRSWDLLKSLGKGGCGEVYLAKERSDDSVTSYVAVKIIKVIIALILGS
jgi:hypothetical protein